MILSPVAGVVVEVHTPMVKAGRAGVEPPPGVESAMIPVSPWRSAPPGDWRARRPNSTAVSVSVTSAANIINLKGWSALTRVGVAISSVRASADFSRGARRLAMPGAPVAEGR